MRLAILSALILVVTAFAQEEAVALSEEVNGEQTMIQPLKLIDSHTAGILPRAHYDLELRIYPGGNNGADGAGMAFSFAVGITDRLNLGAGYGGDGLIGRGKPKPDPYPSLLIKYRIFEESFIRPAIALGFDATGFGGIENDTLNYKGFIYKSQGFFAAFSKNYLLFKRVQLGLHGSVNYSLEERKTVRWPNVFLGLDLGFNEELALNVEYDMGLNQKDPYSEKYANPLKGIVNLGLRWNVVPALYVELLAKDLTEMKLSNIAANKSVGWSRELRMVYCAGFNSRRDSK